MNLGQYLNSKGYGANQMSMNGNFMLIVHKEGKIILKVSAPPLNIHPLEFEKQLFDVVKSQIEIYEGGEQ